MDSGKEGLFSEMAAALLSALHEAFPDVPPCSYMFPQGACSMSGFIVNRLEEMKEK